MYWRTLLPTSRPSLLLAFGAFAAFASGAPGVAAQTGAPAGATAAGAGAATPGAAGSATPGAAASGVASASAPGVAAAGGVLGASVAPGSAEPAAGGGGMRLDAAIRLALANNERARRAGWRVEVAEGQVARARSAFLPSVVAGGTATQRLYEDNRGARFNSSASLTITQPLVNASPWVLYAQSRRARSAERYAALDERRVLAFDTARAFVQALTSENVLEAALRRRERAEANLANARARAEAQLASTNDVTRAQLEFATANREVGNARGGVERGYLQLGYLVGAPVRGPLAPPDGTTQAAELFAGSPAALVNAALGRRPDVRAQHHRVEAARFAAAEPNYRFVPQLSLAAQSRVSPDPTFTSDRWHDETLSLNLSWPIWDAGVRDGDRRSREAQAEIAALDERLLRRGVGVEVGAALASLKAAREAYQAAGEGVEAARRNVEEAEILYRQGLARGLELVTATAQRFEAEVGLATTKLNMEQAYLELRFAVGLSPTDETPVTLPPSPEGGSP
ncbi:MAG TPA: TolC family protein [Polyangiaceae bacterium]|nr:TolC family protein [Polyangiaceae bacterium]